MIGLSLSEIQEYLSRSDLSKFPEFQVSVLRNIMLEPIEPYLRYMAYQIGLNAQVKFGGYDNVFQDAVGGKDDLLSKNTDCILVFTKLDTLSSGLARNFTALSASEIQAEIDRIKDYITNVLSGIRKQTAALVLWHGFELPVYPAFGILESQKSNGQLATINNLNEFLKSKLNDDKNAYFVDLNLSLVRLGANRFYDSRYWHIGRAPFTREALLDIASEEFKFIRALKGKNKKCLALDCDNVLWGGIVGEDGLSGIKLGKTYPGSAYYEFQQEVLNLHNRGVILALCSRNNEEDVWEVFKKHPDMLIKQDHITTTQINWRDKATNLKQIALDLNIALDSIVFVDDSEFEVNLIRKCVPEVEVIHMPPARTEEFGNILASCGLFDTLALSSEDKKRGVMYKAEAARKKFLTQFADLESYYKSLEMEIDIGFADEFSIPRIAQLSQKTNQFNLTTRRYSEADIWTFSNSDKSDVIYIRLKDIFGDSGIVGVCILKYEDEKAIFDTFLLSCRVLGRCIEEVFLVETLKLVKKRGAYKVAIGEYYPTRKNSQVELFYKNNGFEEVEPDRKTTTKKFQYNVETKLKPKSSFFKKINARINQSEKGKR